MGNREKLLEKACSTFGQKGYKATSVDDLLEAAGVSPSNFYYHFDSKEKLAYEVLDALLAQSRARIEPIFADRKLRAATKGLT